MAGPKGSSSSFITRRRFAIAGISLALFILFAYVIRERYFYRADVLIAIQTNVHRQTESVQTNKDKEDKEEDKGGLLSYLGIRVKKEEKKMNIWDSWMDKQSKMTSIGDIFDKCDNKTRTKIGKVVLEQKKDGSGVQIKSFLNQTYDHEITASTASMEVYYNGEVLYTKVKDMCEAAKELDTPYSCPIKAGHKLVIVDVARLPSYIPKGSYRVFSTVQDQNKKEIGCTYIEFKTGEKN